MNTDTQRSTTAALTLGALGVVYGDIGTSPLYAFKEAIHAAKATSFAGREAVFGVLALESEPVDPRL